MTISPKSKGFTLIEVMIGMILTGILAMGMMGLWSMIGDQFFRLTIRQKAIFVLHGEMERLSALYRYKNFQTQDEDITIPNGNPGHIHNLNTNALITNSEIVVVEETNDTNVTKASFLLGQILFMNYTLETDKNFVWIDRDRDVTARIYWETTPIDNQEPSPTNYECHNNSGACYLLNLTLEYPFRFNESTNPAEIIDTWGATKTVTLQTIVGGR
ncbi:MAG: prepilin-type N-terminal cleavage/methylation domain-containing protein [Magnetococcales bacterium]|nr:prepilin-type N-terminal cleavage/methylation domain-containing protein [Magnetococcales bacterium]